MKSKKKEQNFVGSYSLRKELSLVPSYLVLVLWVGFTAVILLWVIAASLSTTSDIFTGNVFGFTSGVHIENYARAWTAGNVSVFFMNSLIYSVISCALLILVCSASSSRARSSSRRRLPRRPAFPSSWSSFLCT